MEELILKEKIRQLYNELPLLCDEDYYNACNMIEQLELQLKKIQGSEKDKEIERLLNIMRPEKADYDYIELLFEGKSKEEVIKSFVYKCEQLENLYKCYEDKEIERLNSIITELEKWLWEERYNHQGEYVFTGKRKVEDIYTMILDKLKELKEENK